MLSDTPLLEKLKVVEYLNANGFAARTWKQMSADSAYDVDAGITDADYAVAETGTIVIRHRPENGRLLSLVPFVHIAVVEPKISSLTWSISFGAASQRTGRGAA